MAVPDPFLLFFALLALLLGPKEAWKRTALYVLIAVMIGDVIGAILIPVHYHFHPAILDWVRYLSTLGAVIGGAWGFLIPTPAKTPEDSSGSENSK
jgi:disulfide bond formation protein DsbB